MNSRNSASILILAVILGINGTLKIPVLAAPADAQQVEKPVAKKGAYLNQSQDRVIKKKAFKSVDVEGVQAIPNKEIGLFAVVDPTQISDATKLNELLSDPRVNGLSTMFTWQQLEPQETKYDWQPIDKVLEACQGHGKTLILRVSTSGTGGGDAESNTPKWVFQGGAKSLAYKGSDGHAGTMPVYWDSTYLAKWSNFVRALGERYDQNSAIHSIGITGGGIGGGTAVLPDFDKQQYAALEQTLKSDYKMTPHQLVEHWKYVADLFPSAFKTARLNFDIDPPLPTRAGQDMLDEISDYLVYRYGERIYLTRQNVDSAKHGFDQYRVLLKFRPDTLTGYQLVSSFPAADLDKLVHNSLDDGASFAEIPADLFVNKEPAVTAALEQLQKRLGYQLISQKVTIPADIKSGAPLKAGFTFINLGAAVPMRPSRQNDKDIASSYRVQLELRDINGKPVVQSLHTPAVPTNKWSAGEPISWEEELKMPKLPPGEYSVWMSLVDTDTKRKLQIVNATAAEKHTPESTVAVGKIQVLAD
jgi:hypothetical protein